jgi:hypothetical protein
MDHIEDRLKDLISYVNRNSSFDLLGVALDFYEDKGLQILIPTLYGAEPKKSTTSASGERRQWDAQSFFADAEGRLSAAQVKELRALHGWSLENADHVVYGTGSLTASFGPKFAVCRRSVFTAGSDGRLTLNFKWLTDPEPATRFRDRFGGALVAVGFALPNDFASRFVSLAAGAWMPHRQQLTDALIQAIGGAVQQ